MSENFKQIVADSPVLQERMFHVSRYIIEEVEAKHGVKITQDDVAQMSCAKLSVLGNTEYYLDDWESESSVLPSVAKAIEEKRLIDALGTGTPEGSAMAEKLAAMKAHERLTYCRENNISVVAKTQADANDGQDDRTALIAANQAILDPGRRISHARANGLV